MPQNMQPSLPFEKQVAVATQTIQQMIEAPLRFMAVGIDKRQYQDVGIIDLWQHKRRMLRDAPGLGKTPQAALASEPPVLVVAPNYLVGQWAEWLNVHFPMMRTVAIKGDRFTKESLLDDAFGLLDDPNPAQFTVINTEMLRTHKERLLEYALLDAWTTVIFDESHHLRNRNSERGKTAVELARIIPRVYLLTATPIWKEVDDLYNQFRILQPAMFTSYGQFVNNFCIAESTRYGTRVMGVKRDMVEELDEVMNLLTIGRSYKDAGRELPQVISSDVKIDFDESMRKMYDDVLNNFRVMMTLADAGMTADDLRDWNKENAQRSTTLYGIAPTPSTTEDEPGYDDVLKYGYNPDDFNVDEEAEPEKAMLMFESYSAMMHTLRQITGWYGKIEAVTERIMDAYKYTQGRTVVFTWYRDLAFKITDALNKIADEDKTGSIKHAVCLTGNITDPERRRQLAMGDKIVVATIPAISEGLDLSWGRQVIFAEEHYAPGSHIQAMARVVRDRAALNADDPARDEPVLVDYIQTKDTIDEIVHDKSQQRGSTIKEVMREAVGLL